MEERKNPFIYILATGGTIAAKPEETTKVTGYHDFSFDGEKLIDCIPDIRNRFSLKAEEIFQIDSSCIQNHHLLLLAKKANEILSRDEVDGLVITHGTDTMEETAFFLNLTVKSKKPVILTGSMRPTSSLGADGPSNLHTAIRAAGEKESYGKGVMIAFADRLWPARDAIKSSTYHTDAFRCAEGGPLGVVIDTVRYYYASTRPHTTESEFDVSNLETLPDVQIITNHANTESTLISLLMEKGCDGIILAGVGNGTLPPETWELLKKRKGMSPKIVRASRTQNGFVSQSGDFSDEEHEIIPSGGFSPQKARILLQLALTKTRDYQEICRIFDRY